MVSEELPGVKKKVYPDNGLRRGFVKFVGIDGGSGGHAGNQLKPGHVEPFFSMVSMG
jgi:hypothetical protein